VKPGVLQEPPCQLLIFNWLKVEKQVLQFPDPNLTGF